MRNNPLYEKYSPLIKNELFLNDGGGHGAPHTKRVLYLAMTIAQDYDLTETECEILALACCYHDIGRVNNDTDDNHGKLSARKVVRLDLLEGYDLTEKEKDSVLMLIEMHCLDDFLFNGDNRELLLYQILKDADGLDRVRYFDLDTRYLRLETSKMLVKTAGHLLFEIR